MDSVQPPHPQQPPSAHSSSAAASQPDSARRPSSAKPDDSPAASVDLFSIPSDVRRAVAAADIVKPAGQTLEEIRADAAAAAGSVHSSAAGRQSADALSRTSSLASSKLQGVPASRSRIGALERQPSSESGVSTRQAVAAAAAAAIIPAAPLPHSSHPSESPRSLASSPGNEIPRPQEQQQQHQLELSRRSSVASSQHPRGAVPEDSFRTSSSFAFGGGGVVGGDAASSPAASNPDPLEESANPPPSRSPHNPSSRLSARPDAGHPANAAADLEHSRRSTVASSHRHGGPLDVSQRSGASAGAARPVALPSGGGGGGGGSSVASFGKGAEELLHASVRSSTASESRAAAPAPVQRLSSSRHSIVRDDESAAPGSSPAATLRNDASASGAVSNQPPSRRSSVASSSRREAPPAQHRSAASASAPAAAAAAAVPRSEPSAAEVDTPEKKTIGQGFDRAAWFEKLRQAERRAASEHVSEPIPPPPPQQPASASGGAEPARDVCMDTSIRDSALGSVAEAVFPPRSSHASESPRSLASSPGNEIPRPQEQEQHQLELSRRSSVASSQHPRGVSTSEAPRFAAATASAGPSVHLSRPDTASAEGTARHIPVDPPSHLSVRSAGGGAGGAAAAFPSTASSDRETQQGHMHAPLAASASEAQQSSTQQSSTRTVQHHPEADRESLGGGGAGAGAGAGGAAVSRGSSAARLGSMSMRSRTSSAAVPENVLEAEEALEDKVEYLARRSTASSVARWQTGGASLPRWGVGGGGIGGSGVASASGCSASSPQPSSPPHPRRPPDAAPAVARARAERVRSATKGLGTDEAALFGLAEEIASQAEWDAVRAAFRDLHPSVYGGDVSGTLRADLSQAEWERFTGILAARGVAVDAAVPSRPPSFSSSAAVVRAPSHGGSGVEAACPTFEAQAAAMQTRQPALYHEACILFGDVVAELVTGGAGDPAAAAFRRSVVFFGVAARVGHDADGGVKRAKRLVVVTAEAVYTVSVGGRVQRLVPLPSVSEVQYSDTAFGLRVASGFDLSLELSTAAGLFAFVAALKAVAAPTCPFTYLNDAARDLSLGRPASYVPVRPPSVSLNPLTAALPVEAATVPRSDSAGLVDLGRLLWDPATNTPTFVQTAPAVVTGGASPVRIRGKVVAEGLLVSRAPAAE